MDNQKQVNAPIPVGSPSTGASPESEIDLQKLAWQLNVGFTDATDADATGLYFCWVKPGVYFDVRLDDTSNSAFIVWGLDALTKAKLSPSLWVNSEGLFCCEIWEGRDRVYKPMETRVLAVAWALSETLASEPNQKPNPTPANKESTSQKAVIQEPLTGAEKKEEG